MTCEPGNTEKQVILMTREPGSTEKRIILMTCAPGNSEKLLSDCTVRGNNQFWEHVPGKMNMVFLEVRSKQTFSSKWLPRPNHYAHEICIEILSRTPVSKSKYLSYKSDSKLKTPNVIPWPECQPEGPWYFQKVLSEAWPWQIIFRKCFLRVGPGELIQKVQRFEWYGNCR